MQALLSELAKSGYGRGQSLAGGWQPAVDMYETATQIVVVVDLAGIRPEDVQVIVKGRLLRIAGARPTPFRSSYRQFHRLEIPQGPFERVVELPSRVDEREAEARYSEGLLEIVLPLAKASHPVVRTGVVSRETGGHE